LRFALLRNKDHRCAVGGLNECFGAIQTTYQPDPKTVLLAMLVVELIVLIIH